MQRIKLDVFKTFFKKNLTGNEIDFLIALSQMQDIKGEVCGVHYKEMADAARISIQAFYDCKKSLEEKGMIRVTPICDDYDITFLGNDFSMYTDRDYKEKKVKYLSTNQRIFQDLNWKKLKPKQKLLAMDLLNINRATGGNKGRACTHKISRNNFFEKYANEIKKDGTESKGLLNIGRRTLQKYLKLLKLYFDIQMKDGLYLILVRDVFTEKTEMLEENATYKRLVQAACRRLRIKERKKEEEKKILELLVAQRKKIYNSSIYIPNIFLKMVQVINDKIFDERKWQRRLKASLFNKLLTDSLNRTAIA